MKWSLRHVAERLSRGRVIRRRLPTERGWIRWYTSPDAALGHLRWNVGVIDPLLADVTARYVRPGMAVWDIGANVGLFTFLAAAWAGPEGRVLAIEPDPWLVSVCLQRTRRTLPDWCARVDIGCFALADDGAVAALRIAARGRAANALEGFGSTQTGGIREEVLVTTLTMDDLLERTFAPGLVKIDVEGAEWSVLRGASRLLTELRPTLVVEVSRHRDEVGRLLAEQGYRLLDAEAGYREIERPAYNTVAVPAGRPQYAAARRW